MGELRKAKRITRTPATLLLEDGKTFYGRAAGFSGTAAGELCFNTGMTGYQEIFTDPSYYGQILVAATCHIGNYGVHQREVESETPKIAGLVCKKFSLSYSRPSAEASIQEYFERQRIVAVTEVDTRAVVRHVRDKGAMNAVISSVETEEAKLRKVLAGLPSMNGLELSSNVTTPHPYTLGDPQDKYRVAVLDLGVKKNILHCLLERNCFLQIFPMHTGFSEIKKWEPDGILLSNGPGDPAAMPGVLREVKEMLQGTIPLFGICLGHQLLGLACGFSTYKMHNGHRGVNHPVKNLRTNTCEITSQNHGFVVNIEDARKCPDAEITHVHLNDGTLAGFMLRDKPVFSVQFHPESSAGPNDSRYLFDLFIKNMREARDKNAVGTHELY